VFNTQDFDWRPLHNPISSLVYGATGYSVDTVLVAGEVVLKGGHHTRIDLEEVRARVEEIDRNVLRRLGVSPTPAWPIVDDSSQR
jgi:5-methylthioadenosine/S-adenosylhomocysteine deaminase